MPDFAIASHSCNMVPNICDAAYESVRSSYLTIAVFTGVLAGACIERRLPAFELLSAFLVVLAGRDQGGVFSTA